MLYSVFLTKLLTLGISFSTALRAILVAKVVILGISTLTTFILALRESLVAKLVILRILSAIFFVWALYTTFLTTPYFTRSLNLLKGKLSGLRLL